MKCRNTCSRWGGARWRLKMEWRLWSPANTNDAWGWGQSETSCSLAVSVEGANSALLTPKAGRAPECKMEGRLQTRRVRRSRPPLGGAGGTFSTSKGKPSQALHYLPGPASEMEPSLEGPPERGQMLAGPLLTDLWPPFRHHFPRLSLWCSELLFICTPFDSTSKGVLRVWSVPKLGWVLGIQQWGTPRVCLSRSWGLVGKRGMIVKGRGGWVERAGEHSEGGNPGSEGEGRRGSLEKDRGT